MELVEVLSAPTRVEPWRLGESELVSTTTALFQRMRELEALQVRFVADLESRGTAKTLGASGTAAWLSGIAQLSPGAAVQLVRLGKALAELPATSDAVDAGRISAAHAKVIVGFLSRVPNGLGADAAADCEQYLLEAAPGEDPVALARRAAALRHMLEPVENGLPDAENAALNELFASTTLGGRGVIKADIDAETMEMLQTALSALSQPHPGADGAPDRRSPARRRADALGELLRWYLNSGDGPIAGYERPHLSLLIGAEDLAHAGCDGAEAAPGQAGTPATDSAAQTGPQRATEPEPGPEPEAVRTANSGSMHAGSAVDGQPPKVAPDRGAYARLFGADPIAPGWMPWTGPISAASARRIGCDCELTAILIDGEGVPLNLGRRQRLVSPAQRRALIARDHGCAFPGCGRPPAWTQAHHIRHWIDGGATDLANLVLLCGHHHRVIHHNGWDVVLGADGHPWFLPPEWMDPLRQARPAQHRQQQPTSTAA